MGDWYRARFTAGTRRPVTLFFYTDATGREQIENAARRLLVARTLLHSDNWEMTELAVDQGPPHRL